MKRYGEPFLIGMKRTFLSLVFSVWILVSFFTKAALALPNVENEIGPIPCQGVCPPDLQGNIYGRTQGTVRIPADDYSGDLCTGDYEIFLTDPARYHYWAEDPEVTNQGKADERARQFIYWVVNSEKIEHPVLGQVWNTTRNIAYFLVILVAVAIGVGFIISQRTNYNLKIQIWPAIWKILFALLFITFSFAIVTFLIDMSEILMKFFIDQLGGRDLFNIYFTPNQSSEFNYTSFYGCRDMNIRSQEAAEAELTMLRMTNVTYYVMGTMLLLRKILLWFLIFVSPFLAILMPFVFIRNTGFIWIGVFFQWLFYGPLFALFLGALSKIWKAGIPLKFDFSRVGKAEGYVYPTAIRILYGGPAQRLQVLNNANYIDTFVEYIITLIMLWAVTFFPWWLLRIFRDYCCDVFAAANNVLLQMYDQMRAPPPGTPPATPPPPAPAPAGLKQKIPNQEIMPKSSGPVVVRLESMREIREAKTSDIVRSLNLAAPRLTDIARFETNKESKETSQKTLQYLSNPVKASTPAERQSFMNLRTELFSRSVRQDKEASRILSSTTTSITERKEKQKEILKSMQSAVPVSEVVSKNTSLTKEKVQSITNNIMTSVTNNTQAISNISKSTSLSETQVKSIMKSYAENQNTNQSMSQIVKTIAQAQNVSTEKVSEVLEKSLRISTSQSVMSRVAEQTKISSERIQEILRTIPSRISESVKAITTDTTTRSVISSIFSAVSKDTTTVKEIQKETGLTNKQVQTAMTTYVNNIDQPAEVISQRIHEAAGIEKEKVKPLMEGIVKRASDQSFVPPAVIDEVAKKEHMTPEQVKKVIDAQVPAVTAPEQSIEESVPIPSTVSIEDYEEVKKMWSSQYQKGEIPLTEAIKNRSEWVDQDIVTITNTLNKLMSTDEKLRMEGLDDIGYILPIFMINNMQGDELMVYLKAKLEAAKAVKTQMDQEIEAKLEETVEEEFVDIARPKAEAKPKVLHMALEQEEAPRRVEVDTSDRFEDTGEGLGEGIASAVRAVQAKSKPFVLKVSEIQNSSTSEILHKLDMAADRLIDIARMETDRQKNEQVRRHVDYLSDPQRAASTSERQTYASVRDELSKRADNADTVAKQLIAPAPDTMLKSVPQAKTAQDTIAHELGISNEQLDRAMHAFASRLIARESFVQQLMDTTHLSRDTVERLMRELGASMNVPGPSMMRELARRADVSEHKASRALQTALSELRTHNDDTQLMVQEIAKDSSLQVDTVTKLLNSEVPTLVGAVADIEKAVSIPQSISLADYEEVKTMWRDQYEHGEVPALESVATRMEWIEKEIMIITNTLNKLLSNEEKMRREGLEDLGYILPVFMANNMQGDEMLVYLKAKLEAAKSVQEQLEKENALKQQLKEEMKQDEDLVEVAQPKKEVEKEMAQELAIEEPGDEKEESKEMDSKGSEPEDEVSVDIPDADDDQMKKAAEIAEDL